MLMLDLRRMILVVAGALPAAMGQAPGTEAPGSQQDQGEVPRLIKGGQPSPEPTTEIPLLIPSVERYTIEERGIIRESEAEREARETKKRVEEKSRVGLVPFDDPRRGRPSRLTLPGLGLGLGVVVVFWIFRGLGVILDRRRVRQAGFADRITNAGEEPPRSFSTEILTEDGPVSLAPESDVCDGAARSAHPVHLDGSPLKG